MVKILPSKVLLTHEWQPSVYSLEVSLVPEVEFVLKLSDVFRDWGQAARTRMCQWLELLMIQEERVRKWTRFAGKRGIGIRFEDLSIFSLCFSVRLATHWVFTLFA